MITLRHWEAGAPYAVPDPDCESKLPKQFSIMECHAHDLPGLLDPKLASEAGRQYHIGGSREKLGSQRMKGEAAWFGGVKSLEEMDALVRHGWTEGVRKLDGLRKELAAALVPAENIKQRPCYAEQGSDLEPFRALAGDWEVAWMGLTQSQRVGPRVLTIAGTWGGNCNVTAEELFWQGAQMLVSCELLEDAGYFVELVAVAPTESWAGVQLSVVTAKEAHEPLRLDHLAALFAHAGSYRTYGFAGIMTGLTDFGDGLGHHCEVAEPLGWLSRLAPIHHPAPDFILPDAHKKQQAVTNITAMLRGLADRNAAGLEEH